MERHPKAKKWEDLTDKERHERRKEMRKEAGGRWRSKSGKDRWSKVNKWKQSHKPNFKMLFTGRELLLSSIKEKCVHRGVTKALEDQDRVYSKFLEAQKVEQGFVKATIDRIKNCNKILKLTS